MIAASHGGSSQRRAVLGIERPHGLLVAIRQRLLAALAEDSPWAEGDGADLIRTVTAH
jgi:hypothetical protein